MVTTAVRVRVLLFFESGNLILDNVSSANGLFISVVHMQYAHKSISEAKPKTLYISRIQLGKTLEIKNSNQSGFVWMSL